MKSKLNRFHLSIIGFYGGQFLMSIIPAYLLFIFFMSEPKVDIPLGPVREPAWMICVLVAAACFAGQLYMNQDHLRRIKKKIRKYSTDGTHWFTEYQIQRELHTLATHAFQLKDLEMNIHQLHSTLRVTLTFMLIGEAEDEEIIQRKAAMETSLKEGFGIQQVELSFHVTKSVISHYE